MPSNPIVLEQALNVDGRGCEAALALVPQQRLQNSTGVRAAIRGRCASDKGQTRPHSPCRHAAMPPGLPPVDLATQRAAVYCVDDRIVVSHRSFTFTIDLSVVLAWRVLSFLPILSSLTETRKSRDLFTPSYPPPDLASCHTATIFHTSLSRQLAVSQTTAASILSRPTSAQPA